MLSGTYIVYINKILVTMQLGKRKKRRQKTLNMPAKLFITFFSDKKATNASPFFARLGKLASSKLHI